MAKKEIKKLIELLNYLDGRGIVFEDEELLKKEVEGLNFKIVYEK